MLAARAWDRAKQLDKELAVAERGFGTVIDATARQIAGMVQANREEAVAAQVLLTVALQEHTALGDHGEAARDAHMLAGVLLQQRRLTDALDLARLCVDHAKRGANLRVLGYGLLAEADILSLLGDVAAARAAFVDASSVLGAWPSDVAWVLLKHGMLMLDLEDQDASATLLGDALALAEANGVAQVITAAHLNLAVVEQQRGHADAAQRHLDAVPATVRATPSAAYVAAKLAADRGDRAEANRLLASAAEHPYHDDGAWHIAIERGALAEHAGERAVAEQRYREAIALVESIRARATERELRPWILAHRRAPYEALFALLATEHRALEALEVAEQLHARTWLDAVSVQAAPRAGSMQIAPAAAAPSLTSRDLLAALGAREALIYVQAAGGLWRIHVTADHQIALVRLSDAAMQLIEAWREHPNDDTMASRLGKLLIPEALATSDQALYIVAAERLAQLPFAALRRQQLLLIDERPLVRLPGLAALRCRPRVLANDDAVVLGDARGDLPGARAEALAAAVVLKGHADVGAAATLTRAFDARRAWLFHAAVHAGVDAVGGGLELADGRLTGVEIIARGIAPTIAVLAGCDTAGSRDSEGWGGLPSALLVAGTQSVVATLRPVNDTDAAEVIRRFYRADGGRHPARALQLAQRALAAAGTAPDWRWFVTWGQAEPDACAAPP